MEWTRTEDDGDHLIYDDEYTDEDDLDITDTIRTNFFLCTLLTRCTETGVQFALETNFRKATVDALKSTEKFPKSLYDHCYVNDEKSSVFASDTLQFFMYNMQKTNEETEKPSGQLLALAKLPKTKKPTGVSI
jgi:hypothetical protein